MTTSRRKKIAATALAAVPAAVAAVAVAPESASAHNVTVWWGDNEDTLGQAYVNQGNIVALWQYLLYVHGFLPRLADGQFGPVTADALSQWQFWNNLTPDGVAGPNSWRRAAQVLEPVNEDADFVRFKWENASHYVKSPLVVGNKSNGNWKFQPMCSSTDYDTFDTNHPGIGTNVARCQL